MDNGLIYFYSNDLIEDENLVNGYDETIDSSGKFISVTLPPPISDSLITASTSSFSTKIMELFHRIETSSKPPIIFLDDLCGIELGFDDNGISFLALLHSYLSAGKVTSLVCV